MRATARLLLWLVLAATVGVATEAAHAESRNVVINSVRLPDEQVAPGVGVGGALWRDASGRNTGVVINGRELHVLDVVRLQQVTPVYRGSYWMDANGTFGVVGGPSLGNLWLMSQRSGTRREGILSTYDRTGAIVIGGR